MRYIIQLLLIVFVSGCSESLEEQTSKLVNAKNIWLKIANNQNYSFKYKRNCFCAFSGEEVLIKVEGNKVISAEIDGTEVPARTFLTVIGHYKQILELLKRQEREGDLTVAIQYDSNYGYPTKIIVKSSAFDASSTQHLSNLKLQK